MSTGLVMAHLFFHRVTAGCSHWHAASGLMSLGLSERRLGCRTGHPWYRPRDPGPEEGTGTRVRSATVRTRPGKNGFTARSFAIITQLGPRTREVRNPVHPLTQSIFLACTAPLFTRDMTVIAIFEEQFKVE